MPRKSLIALLCAVCALIAVPASASAAINVSVGIGDQNATTFDVQSFKDLRVKKVRYFIRWNAVDNPGELALADAYVNKAKASGVRVLMHISSDVLVRAVDARRNGTKAAKLPTVKQYRSKVGALVRRYGRKKLDWGVWNEANHDTQPTYRNPKRAAQFFLEMRRLCRGCKIVALDILDQRGAEKYIQRFYSALGSRRRLANVVGIHNYSDTNRYRSSGTRSIIRATKRYNRRAKFWLTETGGVVRFASFTCNPNSASSVNKAERRQDRAIRQMFKLTRQFRRDVQRLYIYNFVGTNCTTRFDTGIVRADGSPRPAYNRVKREMRNFKR
jgi:hypothetical protein